MANIGRPLFHELSRAADSHDIRDQLSVLFRREVTKDLVKMEDYFKLSDELRIGVDDMEKASRLALMAREIQDKVYEKNTFIAKLRE
ncbi:hypothetical protein Tco_0631809 [Tanacetum coccineum]